MDGRLIINAAFVVWLAWPAAGHPLHPIKARSVEPPRKFSFQQQKLKTELTPDAKAFLDTTQTQELWKNDKLAAVKQMRGDLQANRGPREKLGLAELEGTAGFSLSRREPSIATELFLRAALLARQAHPTNEVSPLDPRLSARALLLHNESLAAAIRLLRTQSISSEKAPPHELLWRSHNLEVTLRCGDGFLPRDLSRLELCADYETSGLSQHSRSGLGVTGFTVEEKREVAKDTWFPPQRSVPWTAWLGESMPGQQPLRVELRIAMPLSPHAENAPQRHLAEDLTTPLAYMMDHSSLSKLKRLGLLRPDEVPDATGLFTLTPYVVGRIPVVFVHGLYSSPGAFAEMYNDLMADPELRRRYHLFFFQYPTGNPFLYSTHHLRTLLRDLYDDYSYGQSNPAFDHMVLVGHSMGGILTKMQVTDSGDRIWQRISDRPIEEVEPDPSERELLRSLLFFEHQPFIRRVVFMATPHQGSELAASILARTGARMIRLPRDLTALHDSLSHELDPMRRVFQPKSRPPTSIDDLAPHSPILQVLSILDRNPAVRYHSIVGNILPGPVTRGTDGVVPYRSAHIDGVESELVIRSSHSCERHPEAIREVKRVLQVHLVDVDRQHGVHSLAQ